LTRSAVAGMPGDEFVVRFTRG